MVKVKAVRKLLKEIHYRIKVEKLKEGCLVTYPKRVHSYTLTDSGFIFSDENSKTYLYNLPDYAIRVGVSVHIMRLCHDMDFHPRMLEYYVGSGRVRSMEQVLDFKGDEKKERLMCGLAQNYIQSGHTDYWLDYADGFGVKESFQEIIDIWENQ